MITLTRNCITALIVGASLVTLNACSESESPSSSQASHEEDGSTNQSRIDIPATVRSNLGITFARVERRQVSATIRIPGSFELQPLARREYRMTLPGEIGLAVDQYHLIEPGDLLFRFRSPVWAELQHEIIAGEQEIESAKAAIDVAQARISVASQRLEFIGDRLASLTQAQIRNAELESQRHEIEASLPLLHAELAQAQTSLANSHRTHQHALHRAASATSMEEHELSKLIEFEGEVIPAYRTFDWVSVYATNAGVVEFVEQTDGAFVEAHELVVSIVDPTRVRFRALALQADLPRLMKDPTAQIVPPNATGIAHDDTIDARLAIGLEANPEQRTVSLIATPTDIRPWVRPGVSAFLEVVTESTESLVLAIPRSAIVKDGIVHVFFRRDPKDPNKAIRVEADMGISDGRWVAINSGLSLTDEVILDGAYELKLASEQSGVTQKGGHFHADGTFHNEED